MPSANRIMVIEDDPDIRDVLMVTFTEEAYEVRGVGSGGAALDLLHEWPPDLIVLDLHLADMGGEAFLIAYREAALPTTRVLLLSAASNVMSEGARLGVTGVLAKPFELDALLDTIEALLRA